MAVPHRRIRPQKAERRYGVPDESPEVTDLLGRVDLRMTERRDRHRVAGPGSHDLDGVNVFDAVRQRPLMAV
jgi:hypothetical protein